MFVEELLGHEADQLHGPVVPAQIAPAHRGKRPERALLEGQHGGVVGSASQVADEDLLAVAHVLDPVIDGRRGRLLDHLADAESRQLPGPLRVLDLERVEVSRASDHGLLDALPEMELRVRLDRLENLGRDFHRAQFLEAKLGISDGPFDPADDVLLVGHPLVHRHLADDDPAFLDEDHRRGRLFAVGVGNYPGNPPVIDVRGRREGCAQIDADRPCHHQRTLPLAKPCPRGLSRSWKTRRRRLGGVSPPRHVRQFHHQARLPRYACGQPLAAPSLPRGTNPPRYRQVRFFVLPADRAPMR